MELSDTEFVVNSNSMDYGLPVLWQVTANPTFTLMRLANFY
jgi:hypothetical protein